MIKVVLFDLDDTLFDHRYAARCVLRDLRERHAALQRFPLDVLEREDFRLLQEKHQLVLAGTLSLDEARELRVRALFEFCGEYISDDRTIELASRRRKIYRESRRPVPGAAGLLRALRARARIGIVTNNMTEEQRGKIDACGFASLVDALITSEEAGHTKPSPQIFQAALIRLGSLPNESVMIGDSWEVDILGARNAGIRAVWFNRDGTSNPDPSGVREITSLEPADAVTRLILD